MLTTYAKTTWRGMRRHWSYTLINVLGLSVGFVAAFFILLWVKDERAYDTHYEEADRVYRVMRTSSYGDGQVFTWPAITARLDDVLDENYAEIERAALVSWTQNMAFRRDDVTFREEGLHAGPDFFRILSHDFLAGDPLTALDRPDVVVLSESMARRYFPESFEGTPADMGAERVLGQRLVLENRLDVSVTGVFRDPPYQSTYRPDFVLAMEEYVRRNEWVNDWGNNGLHMLVRLTPDADAEAVSDKIRRIIQENTDTDSDVLFLQPLTDIYLRSKYENGQLVGGRIDYVRMFTVVGLFILLIAAINFTNLATARAAQRTLEVGVRKTFGCGRGRLAVQFLSESVFLALFALIVAAVAVYVLLPGFNELTGKHIRLDLIDARTWARFGGIALVAGLAAGWYPAAYLSAFTVIGVLRQHDRGAGRGVTLRRGLVVFQFVLSVLLIVGVGTVSKQLDYIRDKNLGLDREDVFYSRLEGPLLEQYETYRARLKENPAVQSVSASSTSPLSVGSSTSWGVRWDGRDPEDNTLYHILTVGYDFAETMKMDLAAGRDFSRDFGSDSLNVVVNETAARAMGFDEPVGQTLTVWGRTGQIIGVVHDFHQTSLYDPIEPLVMRLEPASTAFVFIRPAPGRTNAALAHAESVFRDLNPQAPYETTFLDAEFEQMYRSETVVKTLAGWFTGLAIFVACLGLFGLASFTAERRTKEIGVRKVLGASVPRIVGLLSREFVGLVLLAFAIAAPASWFAMNRWLEQFEYHTELGWSLYATAAVGVLLVAYVTVGYQAVKAARVNPAESLRSE